jgi:pristinamycin I synthase-3/4
LVICDRQDVGHNPPWDYQDLSPLSSALILEDVLHRHRQQPFNLADDPPLSVLLLRIAPQQHVLSLVHHYVAFDAWSLGLFYRELSLAYAAYAGGSMPHLPPLPFAYADVGVWQQSPAYAEHLAAMSHYWRWQLAKHGSVPALSGSSPAPAPSFAASSFEFVVPGGTLRRLEQLAQRENATLFMLLLASLQTLLARYTRRTEVAVGATVTNRHSLEAEAVLGNFSNRLLLWGNLEGNPSFRQLLRRTRGTTLNAYARQDFPVDSAAVELNPRLEGQGELFPVMLDYINAPLPAPTLRGLAVSRMPAAIDESAYPLHVTARRGHDHLRVRLQVRPDFDVRTTVPHMACHWNTLLAAIAEDPQQRIEHLPIVKSFETWNGAWRGPAQTLSKSNGARL